MLSRFQEKAKIMITKEQANRNLKDFKSVLDSLGIVFYLDGGTLLGAVRDKDFCEDDQDDIDLSTDISEWYKIEKLTSEAKKIGFELGHKWERGEYLYRTKKRTTSQVSFKKDGGKIDLMFKARKGDFRWWTVFKGWEVVYKKIPDYFLGEFGTCSFYNVEYKIPILINEYLIWRYDDFLKKVHRRDYSCYTSDKSIVKNYGEI